MCSITLLRKGLYAQRSRKLFFSSLLGRLRRQFTTFRRFGTHAFSQKALGGRMELDKKIIEALSRVSTATITMVLLKKGFRNVWIRGARPLQLGQPRLVGCAFTMRFIPAREDLATPESLASPRSTRAAIEAMPEGCIAVVDAMGKTEAGTFGDILCARMKKRGVAALVTDGVVRDLSGIIATGFPVWCLGTAAPPSITELAFINWQEPIGCGGVAVFPRRCRGRRC